uniref:Uncharacterized protein n=1 Tax=Anopheles atroparvus TaxID=41427 RepID=A0A182J5C6_ANOAO
MPQRRGWKPPKQDHSVYVQQLFKDFLTRNHGKSANVAPTDTRSHFFQTETTAQQRKQPGIFDRAVYARFERDTNGAFKRQESTAGFRTGLMKWIDQQRHQRQQRTVLQKTTRSDDYLNLPDGFFSGVEQMKLPIQIDDRTLANITTNFIPPATSTPFERGASGVLSDPDEFQPHQDSAADGNKQRGWESFLKDVDEYLSSVIPNGTDTTLVDQQRKELKSFLPNSSKVMEKDPPKHPAQQPTLYPQAPTHQGQQTTLYPPEAAPRNIPIAPGTQSINLDRPSWRDHSLISNQLFCAHHTHGARDVTISQSVTPHHTLPTVADRFLEEVAQEKRNNRPNVTFLIQPFSQTPCQMGKSPTDILLTASPPSPTLPSSPSGGLLSEHTFLLDQTRADDTLMAKLDALLQDEDFNNLYEGPNFDFDFASQRDQAAMEITFPNHPRRANVYQDEAFACGIDMDAWRANGTLDESFACGMDIAETTMYLSQELQNLF